MNSNTEKSKVLYMARWNVSFLLVVVMIASLLHAVEPRTDLAGGFVQPPDFDFSGAHKDSFIDYIHRTTGDAALPTKKRFTVTNVKKFKKNSPLLSSGLLVPVPL